jgi:hypothetical protein
MKARRGEEPPPSWDFYYRYWDFVVAIINIYLKNW